MARRSKLELALERLVKLFEPRIRDAFLIAIQGVKDRVILKNMIAAIEAGDPAKAFRVLGFNQAAMRPLTTMIDQAFEAGGVLVTQSFPTFSGQAVALFDVRNSRAEAWLRDYSSTLVTRIEAEQMTNIRTVVEAAMQAGQNPMVTAKDIVGRYDAQAGKRVGGIVGLTGPQEQYVANARRELQTLDPNYFNRERRDKRFDSTVRKAIASGKPLDADTVSRLTTRYTDGLLELRGETIARTESMEALNRSQYEAYKQAIEQGTLNPENVMKVWDATGDRKMRTSHALMEGQTVGIDQPFVSPFGGKLLYPGDKSMSAPGREVINCRCRVRYEVNWYADLYDDDDDAVIPTIIP